MFYLAPIRGKGTMKKAAAALLAVVLALAGSACSRQSMELPLAPLVSAPAAQATASPAALRIEVAPTTQAPTPSPTLLPSPTAALKAAPEKTAAKKLVATPKPTAKPALKPAPARTRKAARTAAPTATPAPATGLRSQESTMIALVNAERGKAGLKTLAYDSGLRAAALKHSRDMMENGYFDHTSPTYGTFQQRLADSGVKYSTAGENIAFYASVKQAHTGLMNSPGHRANILNPAFTRVGIGIVFDKSQGMYYITQWFAG